MKRYYKQIAVASVVLITVVSGYYFLQMKKGRYSAADLLSVSYKWGVGDTLANHYDSSTGNYQYLDNRDSLIRTKLRLNSNNIIFLHSRANEIGLWNMPDVIANPNADLKSNKVLRYEFVFTYEQQTKKITYLTDYQEDAVVLDAAVKLQKLLEQTIKDAEQRTAVN